MRYMIDEHVKVKDKPIGYGYSSKYTNIIVKKIKKIYKIT